MFPELTAKKRIYAIGDVHGYVDALENMQKAIATDLDKTGIDPHDPEWDVKIIYLGDYIDRGARAFDVIENLIAEKQKVDGIERIFICGNHDTYLERFSEGMPVAEALIWFKYGGLKTLKSYGVLHDERPHDEYFPSDVERLQLALKKALPYTHKTFVSSLKLAHQEDGYIFAHAGIDPRKPLDTQEPDDFMYIREPFLSWEEDVEVFCVHGHTIFEEPDLCKHRLGIDVGVYRHGRLGCVVLEGGEGRYIYADTKMDLFEDPPSS